MKIGVILMGLLLTLSGCLKIDGKQYTELSPAFDIKSYFNGPIKAWGIIQDRNGNIISRFDIDLKGHWKKNIGTLEEDFHFYDGSTQKRVWTITKKSDTLYEGKAGDIIGKAEGKSYGNAAQWSYTMDVPVDGSTYRLKFDDWMWLMNDGVLMNRSYMKKFGITVAEITIFMQKQKKAKK